MLRRLRDAQALVPVIWALEVTNALVVGERRGRLTQAETAAVVAMLVDLPIRVDRTAHERAFRETLDLARALRLSSYDAAYLELAMRTGLPLATGDAALRAAARRTGVALLDA